MATKKSTRVNRAGRRKAMAEIAARAFRSAFKEGIEFAVRASPGCTLDSAVADYLEAMREKLCWQERSRGAAPKEVRL
jgi:hypothetical protein